MAVGDILRVTLKYAGPDGELLVNTLNYVQSLGAATFTLGEMNPLADVFDAALVTLALPCISVPVVYGETLVELVTGIGVGQQGRSIASSGLPGSSAGSEGNIERAIVFRKLTGRAGRKERGRIFLPQPCRLTFHETGIYNAGGPDAAAITAFAAAMLASVDTGAVEVGTSFDLVIFHRSSVTYTLVEDVKVSNLVGVQRRRRIGIGA